MPRERKRVKPTQVKMNGPKKRPPRNLPKAKVSVEPEKPKQQKKSEDKYIKVCETESVERFKEMSDLIIKKEVKWTHYAIEGSKGYHYYRIL
jgi:hypothetical protein